MKRIPFTQSGYDDYKRQYEDLLASHPDAVEDLSKARAMGDLSENGYYKAARQKLSAIDSRSRYLRSILLQAVITTRQSQDRVEVGCRVKLRIIEGDQPFGRQEREYSQPGEETVPRLRYGEIQFHIVGDLEADPTQGKISLQSPIGKALAGKRIGEHAEVILPKRRMEYEIVEIS